MAFFIVCFLFFVVSSAKDCDRCSNTTTVAYFSDDGALSRGSCGYRSSASDFNNNLLAAAAPYLYKDGAGCGACFNITCKNNKLCGSQWTRVFLFDRNSDKNPYGFILSKSAFAAMAVKGKGDQLLRSGTVSVVYERVPCDFGNQKLAISVEEGTNQYFLLLKFLYQAGQTDIVGVAVQAKSSTKWFQMNRNYGAVWSVQGYFPGALTVQLTLISGFTNTKFNAALPANWAPKQVYDTGIQLKDIIAQEHCDTCA